MSFTVEDGTVVEGANAYITTEFADDYFLDRGVGAWATLGDSAKEAAIIAATDYIETRWGTQMRGNTYSTEQELFFPRTYPPSVVATMPTTLMRATAEYALRASSGPLAPDLVYDDTNRFATTTVDEVGPIKEHRVYSGSNANAEMFRAYPAADLLIKPLLRATSGRVIRA